MSPDQLILALDTLNQAEIDRVLGELSGRISRVKIGSVLFSARGPQIIEDMTRRKLKVFLDLKFHDIPNTVADAVVGVCTHFPIDLLTVHASGGSDMIKKTREALEVSSLKAYPKLIAVTVLTSHSAAHLQALGISQCLEDHVVALATLAERSGAHGIVCSPLELKVVKPKFSNDFMYVVPGIRASHEQGKDDQVRTASAKDAIAWGASFLVVGRPLLNAPNPAEVFDRMMQT